ncbi:hypothetical protein [sulfur-oxidizing endosymbiont of Gigantopelta aegis]|uniref:hypothetical protein n=1 Tax=sulfur-oxidizing endosymbiont of Gigantopelta aegis TaxID=2794934 RepID=UPI0018DB8121|nr:hypothetical protein [sulfur-oxidizing endosymbiont of Gigantopelta aegis]
MIKKLNHLRAAAQLERMGQFSSAITSLEEFIIANPDNNKNRKIRKQIEGLKQRLNDEGDRTYKFTFKPILDIPKSLFMFLFDLLSEVLFISMILLIAIGFFYLID